MILLRPFSRRWFFATLLVLAGTAVLVRLGIWQLDQLAQRREFNVYVITQVSMPSFELDDTAMESALTLMEYRAVHVVGVYDFSQQVVLRNQVYQDKIGVNILTPLRIAGSNRAVMVNRGWIPIGQRGHPSLPRKTRFWQDFGSHPSAWSRQAGGLESGQHPQDG
jgi:surfeit locus 1 family protein